MNEEILELLGIIPEIKKPEDPLLKVVWWTDWRSDGYTIVPQEPFATKHEAIQAWNSLVKRLEQSND